MTDAYLVMSDGSPVGDEAIQLALMDHAVALFNPVLIVMQALVVKGVLTTDDLSVYLEEPKEPEADGTTTMSDMIARAIRSRLDELKVFDQPQS